MNKVESWKAAKHGFDVWPDLQKYAESATPMAAIDEPDLERLKWYGIFYRKRVEDGRYMVRVRIPGCELTSEQARTLAGLAASSYAILDVTTRGNIQIQGFKIGDLPGLVDRLEACGLTSRQTGHDNVRNVMTHPWAGLDPEELIDGRPLCRALTDVFMGSREFSDLPRKFNVAVEGRAVPALHCWTQDTSFVAAARVDGSVAFHWLLAGTQGQNPRLAWKVPVWVTEAQAPEVFRCALEVFRREGSREKRDRARLRYLIERIGVEGFLSRVEELLGHRLEANAEAIPEVDRPEDFIGWFAQKQPGLSALGVSIPLGRLTHEQMLGLADLADRTGDGTIRTAYDQGVVIPNIADAHREEAVRRLARLGLEHQADSIARNIVACTGRQFCNIAVSETKGHAFALIEKLRSRNVVLEGIKINMSGCPSACAQTYTGDIGLKGVRVRRAGGTRDAFDIFLGGGVHGPVEMGLGYLKGVDTDQLPIVIESVVREYQANRSPRQSFSAYWRVRLAEAGAARALGEAEYRPPVWTCEQCSYDHIGEDPPVFCPRCAGLRKNFARIEAGAEPKVAGETKAPDRGADAEGYSDIASLAELKAKGKLAVTLAGEELALFAEGDVVHCTAGLCPHEGGPLAQGTCSGGIVTCPWHDWTFHAESGKPADGNPCSLRIFKVKLAADRVLVAPAGSSVGAAAAGSDAPQQRATALEASVLKVLEVIQETGDTRTIRLDNSAGLVPSHQPGQHVSVCVPSLESEVWRSFTISSAPTASGVIDLTIKRNPSGVVSKAIHDLAAGSDLKVRGPAGRFVFDPRAHVEPLVLIAAGSGVTPAMSILRTIADLQLDHPVTLLYGSRTRGDIIFARELDSLRLRLPKLRLVITLSAADPVWTGAVGRVGPELVARHVDPVDRSRYFVCGPREMMRAMADWLANQGVPSDRIHTETFGPAPAHPVAAVEGSAFAASAAMSNV